MDWIKFKKDLIADIKAGADPEDLACALDKCANEAFKETAGDVFERRVQQDLADYFFRAHRWVGCDINDCYDLAHKWREIIDREY